MNLEQRHLPPVILRALRTPCRPRCPPRDAFRRRRRRDRRLRVLRRPVRARAPATRAARRPHRTRPSSAVRHRRVHDAPDQPAPRRARRSLRPAADSLVLEMGHVAAGAARRGLRPQARIHLPLSSARGSRSPTPMRTRGSCSSRRARNDDVADTHWYRPDFDLALVEQAQAAGAIYLDETRLEKIRDARRRDDARRHAPRACRRDHRRLRDRCERPAWLPDDGARHRQRALAMAAADAGTVHALRERRSLGRRRAR